MRSRRIELLSPARDLVCGIAAVDHGADAVYIGAPRFGARAAAGNSLDDIRQLVEYAHSFNVRIYVTVNTILYDDELPTVERLVWDLYHLGVDALIVQDTALLRMHLPPIPLHASTQMDNRTPEKVQLLKELGFSQTVLARELSLQQMADIHAAVPDMPLEAFVHGALCVSYSGQCYASQYCFGRSANRGECAQFCRLPFTLEDANGNTLIRNRHLLSLRDMNCSDHLEEMLDAGISSFKIEGRLKDVSYVKNITAYYRQRLDAILARRPEYVRASEGDIRLAFTPNPAKSFNRGFTDYFLHGRKDDIGSFDTPKSIGEQMGRVTFVGDNYLTVNTHSTFHNGDGACAFKEDGTLVGFRINRAEGGRLYPSPETRDMDWKTLKGCMLYRNYDAEFERSLSRPNTALRRIPVSITFREIPFGFAIGIRKASPASEGMNENPTVVCFPMEKIPAESEQERNICRQLSKLGNTILEAAEVRVEWSVSFFIPSSTLSEMRRRAVDVFLRARQMSRAPFLPMKKKGLPDASSVLPSSYRANMANHEAQAFYHSLGIGQVEPAFEIKPPSKAVLMTCRHCLRYSLGACPRHHGQRAALREPLVLVSADGRRFPLRFDCKRCVMEVMNINN